MTQNQKILKALKRGRKLTAMKALKEFKCFRLASRINDLKNQGFNIVSTLKKTKDGKRFAEYQLIK